MCFSFSGILNSKTAAPFLMGAAVGFGKCKVWADTVYVYLGSAMRSFFFRHLMIKALMPSRMGKPTPESIPVCKLSPASCDTFPTIMGPAEAPKSPPKAKNANSMVPPLGRMDEEILIEPGHMIPTEKPHSITPTKPNIGIFASPAKR